MVQREVAGKTVRLVRGDITDLEVEAFVFDIDSDLKLGAGFGGAITARGGKTIQEELDAAGACPRGEAVVTGGGNLKAKHIIHVNGPKFREPGEEEILRRAVRAALDRAEELGLSQLAVPALGAGLYQVPLELSARVVVETVVDHLRNASRLREVVLVANDAREAAPLSAELEKGV